MTALLGCDYSFSRPGAAKLASLGIKFAARYYSTAGNAKNLTAQEMRELKAAGIDLVSVYETTGDEALGGFRAGVMSANSAFNQAIALGQPHNSAIYFAVDFGPNTQELNTVVEYFAGIASVHIPYRIGVYGGIDTILKVLESKHAVLAWQTLAWSRGIKSPYAAIYQDGTTFPGLPDVDRDFAMHIDYGSWYGQNGIPDNTRNGSDTRETAVQMQKFSNDTALVAVRGTDGYLWMKRVTIKGGTDTDDTGKPYGWTRYFPIGSAPALASGDGVELWIAVLNDKQGVDLHYTPNPFQKSPVLWSPLGGVLVSAPSISVYPGIIVVWGEGLAHEIYRNTWEGGAWSNWLDEHGQAK